MKLTEAQTKTVKSENGIHLNNMLFAIRNATMTGGDFLKVMESYKALSDILIPKAIAEKTEEKFEKPDMK